MASWELPADPPTVLRLLAGTADSWDAAWQATGESGGRLGLPVMAGVRRGWVVGEVTVAAVAGSEAPRSRLDWRLEASEYRLEKATVATLVLAAGGALVTVFAPFFPGLIRLLPVGILLAFGAWLLIISRLRNSGPEEFFDDLETRCQRGLKPRRGDIA